MKYKYSKDIVAYKGESYYKKRLIWELLGNSFRTIKSVYIFENFEEYCKQLLSDKNEEKLKVYWNASYYEKLIDLIKISVAFENFNKAILLKKGIIVHSINHKFNKKINEIQRKGIPIKVSEIFKTNFEFLDIYDKKTESYKVFYENFKTINYSTTLNEKYQEFIGIDKQLLFELKKINEKRNRLHFYTDFSGAFLVRRHIEQWKFIMNESIEIIEREYKIANEELEKE